MADLIQYHAKVCLTAAGCLIDQEKVLLVKHKKVGIWLCPGGHVEVDELPHKAAEREFWEETGVKVVARPYGLMTESDREQYVPSPYASNVHWVCQGNYEARQQNPDSYDIDPVWPKGCEQHLSLLYLMTPTGMLDYHQNIEETDGIAWFSESELDVLETSEALKTELAYAFHITQDQRDQ